MFFRCSQMVSDAFRQCRMLRRFSFHKVSAFSTAQSASSRVARSPMRCIPSPVQRMRSPAWSVSSLSHSVRHTVDRGCYLTTFVQIFRPLNHVPHVRTHFFGTFPCGFHSVFFVFILQTLGLSSLFCCCLLSGFYTSTPLKKTRLVETSGISFTQFTIVARRGSWSHATYRRISFPICGYAQAASIQSKLTLYLFIIIRF